MKTPNRDLLVLVKDEFLNEESMEFELEQLNNMLLHFETIDNLCAAHEIVDMNRYKMIRHLRTVQQVMRRVTMRPFVFICNKN